jgi:hypothetical protein
MAQWIKHMHENINDYVKIHGIPIVVYKTKNLSIDINGRSLFTTKVKNH